MKKFLLKLYYIFLEVKKHYTIYMNKLATVIIKSPNVNSTDETLDKIINEKCSVSRYGNGEFNIMFKGEQFFQEYNNDLRLRLIEIINSKSQNHIVCIPDVFRSMDRFTDKAKGFWEKYLALNRIKIYKIIDKDNVYFDSLVTRLYMDYKDKSKVDERFTRFKMIWDGRDVILVEGEKSRLGAGNNLFSNAKSLKRILCPAENAFSKIDKIVDEIKKYDTTKLVLLALGPTATVLAYDLSQIGYQAVDIGNVDIEYEWYLRRAKVKVPITNKYTGEALNGKKVGKINNQKYENEILAKLF